MALSNVLVWLVAVCATLIFYAEFLTGLPAATTTPVLTAIVLGGMAIRALLGLPRLQITPAGDSARLASTALLAVALLGFSASALFGYLTRPSSLQDWGLFALQIGVPLILLLTTERGQLIIAICKVCVLFASVDAVANLLAVAGLFELPQMTARVDEFGQTLRYPGLTGNTHASGLVNFIGATFLVSRINIRALTTGRNFILGAWIVILLGSLLLIDARRYLVLLICAVPLLIVPQANRIPLPFATAFIAGVMLMKTFTADFADRGNQLRQALMRSGFERAMEHPWLGEGVFYRSGEGLIATYTSLSSAGVTESMILDFAISYGIASTIAFLGACLLAAGSRRPTIHPPAVFLALMTAEFAFGGVLNGVLGSVFFYACLMYCQREILTWPSMTGTRRQPSNACSPTTTPARI